MVNNIRRVSHNVGYGILAIFYLCIFRPRSVWTWGNSNPTRKYSKKIDIKA